MNYKETPKLTAELSDDDVAKILRLSNELNGLVDEISLILHKSLGMPKQAAGSTTGISIDWLEGLTKGCMTITNKDGNKTSVQIPPGICCTGSCPCV